jgi:hypothetical protein
MRTILILAIILTLGCAKQEETCTPYNLVIESSQDSAEDKCDGLANSHPTFKVISSTYVGCLTQIEYEQARKAESTNTMIYCTGVYFTIKKTLR